MVEKRTVTLGIIIKFVLKNIWEKKLRTLLILFSVMLSAALFFATEALADTARELFVQRIAVYYGTADLIIYPTQRSPSGFLYRDQAAKISEKFEYIVGSIETGGHLLINHETLRLGIMGFEWDELQKMNPFPLAGQDNLFPFRGKKIILSALTAEQYGLQLGDYIEIDVLGAKRKFLICALAEPTGPFQDDSQTSNAIVPIDTLATILKARGKVSVLYLKVKEPGQKDDLLQKLSKAYPRYQVRETITGQEMEEYTRSLTTSFQLMGMVVLFMAVYIIYTSFKVITRERLPMIGVFRSIGATKTMTNLVLIAESITYGIIGGLCGCGLGIFLLYLIILQIRPEFLRTVPVTLEYAPSKLLAAFILAVILALVSSILPIIKISKIPVKEIIFNTISKSGKKKWWKPLLGLSLIGSAIAVPPYLSFHLFLPASIVLIFASIIGFILIIPAVTNLFLRIFARVYHYIFGNEGILAAQNLRDNKGILNNISLLAIGISSLLMINTISHSVALEVMNFYKDGNFQIGFWVPYADRQVEAILRGINGVDSTYGVYAATQLEVTNLQERINLFHGVHPRKYTDYWSFSLDQTLLDQLDTGRNVLLTNSLRERLGVAEGEILTLKMARGERHYRVIGFFNSLMWNGSFGLVAERYLKMDMNLQYYDEIYIKTNQDPFSVSKTIKQRLERRSPWVSTMAETEANNLRSNESMFRVMQGFSLLALIIGIFGVFNNLIISFLERQRSLAVLRSLGLSKRQSLKMFLIEALTGGLIGGTVGALSGYLLISIAPLILKAVAADIPMHHSFTLYLVSVFTGIIITVTATTSPAFKSSKLEIVSALKYE